MNNYKQIKGSEYEIFILNKLKVEYDDIWLFKNTPEKILQKTKLLDNYDIYIKYKKCDIGADLVAIKNDQIFFIQCKNHNSTLCINDLQGFYFFLYEFELNGIVIYSNQISSRIKDLSNKVQYIHIPYNNQLIDTNFNILNKCEMNPRDYQLEAYNLLKNEERSILSLPCGMGKTYTAFMIGKEYDNIIIISPLRFLAKQSLDQMYEYSDKSYNPILLSIDGERNINNIILENQNIISSTYDSVDILLEILNKIDNKIVIVDEFHNLSANNLLNENDNFNKILRSNIKILFLSATPIENKLFGTIIYKYLWLKAIEKKYICDFNIVLPNKNESLKKFDNIINDLELNNKNLVSKAYFLLKCLLYEGKQKCIVFLTCIEQADEFNKILLWMQKLLNMELEIDIITYNTSKLKRIETINNFKYCEKISILLNIHILDEGIDIPECDSVFVIQPNDNILNLVQRMCRCNRITNEKNKSLIILWCGDKKIKNILDYINDKTNSELLNKIYKLNINENNKNNYEKIINNENKINILENLKKFSTLNNNFIDEFYDIHKNNMNDYSINIEVIAKWLNTKKGKLKETLLNTYTINIDYKISKEREGKISKSNKELIMLTPECFKRLCLLSKTTKAEEVRTYFLELEKLISNYV